MQHAVVSSQIHHGLTIDCLNIPERAIVLVGIAKRGTTYIKWGRIDRRAEYVFTSPEQFIFVVRIIFEPTLSAKIIDDPLACE